MSVRAGRRRQAAWARGRAAVARILTTLRIPLPIRPAARVWAPAAAAAHGRTVVWCDWPALDGTATAASHLHVVGWAYSARGIEAIEVIAGGRRFVPRERLPRPDVERELPAFEDTVAGFALVIDTSSLPPGRHELIIRAWGAGDGRAADRRGTVLVGPDAPYRSWLGAGRRNASRLASPAAGSTADRLTVHVLDGPGEPDVLEASLRAQTHNAWKRSGGSLVEALADVAATGDPLVLVEARGALDTRALALLAEAISRPAAPDLVYADEDAVVSDGGRGACFLKPGWSPELLVSTDYVGPLVALGPRAAAAALASGDESPRTIYEVLLRIIDSPTLVERIPEVLFTSQTPRVPDDGPATRRAIERLAARRGRTVRIAPSVIPGARDLRWPLTSEPLVSVVIPTCRAGGLLDACLRSLRERTTYKNLEIVIVDSSRDRTGRLSQSLEGRVDRIVRYEGPFNFSEAMNAGARAATGEHLILLNDDTEAQSPDWVQCMLEQLLLPGVGIVGARLLYPDGFVQHAGVVFEQGASRCWHAYAGFPADAPGYHGMLQLTRNYSAVTGACTMVTREVFDSVGGFDTRFAIEFGDIDLCLRLIQRGLRVVWTPAAVLTHHEGSSRARDGHPTDVARFEQRWRRHYPETDPLYHPAFGLMTYEFSGRRAPPLPVATLAPPEPADEIETFTPPPQSLAALKTAVAAGDLVMWCDAPLLDGTGAIDGALTITGWAYAGDGVAGVFAYVGGLRYAVSLGADRRDLAAHFGDGLSRAGFQLTIDLETDGPTRLDVAVVARGRDGRAVGMRGPVECRPAQPSPPPPVTATKAAPVWGVNVAGYLRSELGAGEAARQVIAGLDARGVPAMPVHGSFIPLSRQGHRYDFVGPDEAPFPVNLICVNADLLPSFVAEAGSDFFAGRHRIGLWWWEVDRFPKRWMGSFELIDELWVGSQHIADALTPLTSKPVTKITLPVTVPDPPRRTRDELGLPSSFVFLFMFDFNSVMDRKNPIGLVDAFTRAFPDGSRAVLVIKSINARFQPAEDAELLDAVAGRSDIRLRDGYVSAADKTALLAAADCYVSLHRAEGFGLTLAESMYLGKPVIATGYSGNLDFMTEQNSFLVRHTMVPIGAGADPYPADGQWADPDLDHAAELMRQVVENPAQAAARAARGAADIRARHSPLAAGASMERRLEVVRASLGETPEHERGGQLAARLGRAQAATFAHGRRVTQVEDELRRLRHELQLVRDELQLVRGERVGRPADAEFARLEDAHRELLGEYRALAAAHQDLADSHEALKGELDARRR